MFDFRIHKAPVLVIIVLSVVFCFLLWITGLFPYGKAIRQQFETDSVPDREIIESTGKPNNRRNITKNIPTIMMELFEKGPHDVIPTEIVKSVTPKVIGTTQNVISPLYNERMREHRHVLTFEVPGLEPGEDFHSAQLRLTLAFVDWQHQLRTEIESVVKVYWETTTLLVKQIFNHEKEIYIHFNCTKILFEFHKKKKLQGGLLKLEIGIFISSDSVVNPVMTGTEVDRQPLLLLLYTPHEKAVRLSSHRNLILSVHNELNQLQKLPTHVNFLVKRRKRDTDVEDYEEETNNIWSLKAGSQHKGKVTNRKQRNLCRRRPLYVDFAEIEYDTWIVAPNGYEAFQCVGKCFYPLSDHLNPTKHAIVQTLLHSISPSKAVRPCCVPTKLDSISVLYLDPHGVLTYRFSYKEMVVAECGCR